MQLVEEIIAQHAEIRTLRRDIHAHPELKFEEFRTADLVAARAAVDLPVLRKDFTVDRLQIDEARAMGADAVLLIVAALDDPTLADLHAHAVARGLAVLVEVHDDAELDRALALDPHLVGVNARNLKTLDVDPTTFSRVTPAIPPGVLQIAESGVRGPADVVSYAHQGAHAVLVGEALVTGADPQTAVAEMVAAGSHPTSSRGAL